MLRRRVAMSYVAFTVSFVIGSIAVACNTPVYRFALERWSPDPFEVLLVHRGPLDEGQQALAERIEEAIDDDDRPVNLQLHHVDLDGDVDKHNQRLLDEFGMPEKLPGLLVVFPPHVRTDKVAFRSGLNEANVAALLDSPARREVARRIGAGDSAVWVMVPCGDEKKNAAVEKRLQQELARLEKTLELPPQDGSDPLDGLFPGPSPTDDAPAMDVELQIKFSVLRLDRDAPEEQAFVSMLLGVEPDLGELNEKEPIALPIFGRGRTYYALVGEKGITAENLEYDCGFLVGRCSCEVKRQNPGADLVFMTNWDDIVTKSAIPEKKTPGVVGIGAYEAFAKADPTGFDEAADNADGRGENASGQTAGESDPSREDGRVDASELTDASSPAVDPRRSGRQSDGRKLGDDKNPAVVAARGGDNTPPGPLAQAAGGEAASFDIAWYAPLLGVVIFGLLVVGIGTIFIKSRRDVA